MPENAWAALPLAIAGDLVPRPPETTAGLWYFLTLLPLVRLPGQIRRILLRSCGMPGFAMLHGPPMMPCLRLVQANRAMRLRAL